MRESHCTQLQSDRTTLQLSFWALLLPASPGFFGSALCPSPSGLFPDTATASDRSPVWSLESIEPFSFSILTKTANRIC